MATNTEVTAQRAAAAMALLPSLKTPYGGFRAFAEPDQTERRANCRYPIDLAARYEIGSPDERCSAGPARVINISSSGILIQSERPLAIGRNIRLRIEWPVRLNDLVPLALHITGQTVRAADDARVAVRILRSELRTRSLTQTAAVSHPAP